MITYYKGKNFSRILAAYVILKKDITVFPEILNNEITTAFTEPFEKIQFIDNSLNISISPKESTHGTYYETTITGLLNKNEVTKTNALHKYKFKECICITQDYHNTKQVFGGESQEQFCKLHYSINQGNTNLYTVTISINTADIPPYYTPTITTS